MSRSVFILVFSWILNPVLSAQNDFKTEINIGFSQGAGLSRVVFYPSVDQSLLVGYTGGLLLRTITEPHLGIQLEINYLKRGWTEKFITSGSYERNQEILTIPVMTHIYFGKQTKTRLQFVIGPYIAYILSDSEINSVSDTLEFKDYYGKPIAHNAEFGFSGGVGVSFRTKLGLFELQGKYNHGLTNLFKSGSEEFIYLGSRPQTVDITLHYLVKITAGGKKK
jgi:Outer membrane protein beta-barrel domain